MWQMEQLFPRTAKDHFYNSCRLDEILCRGGEWGACHRATYMYTGSSLHLQWTSYSLHIDILSEHLIHVGAPILQTGKRAFLSHRLIGGT